MHTEITLATTNGFNEMEEEKGNSAHTHQFPGTMSVLERGAITTRAFFYAHHDTMEVGHKEPFFSGRGVLGSEGESPTQPEPVPD